MSGSVLNQILIRIGCFPTLVLTNRFKGSGFSLLNSEESPRKFYYTIEERFLQEIFKKCRKIFSKIRKRNDDVGFGM